MELKGTRLSPVQQVGCLVQSLDVFGARGSVRLLCHRALVKGLTLTSDLISEL